MLKRLFFKIANYTDPTNYEKQYDNPKCQNENEEIKRILNTEIPHTLPITDIGCGTGMARSLLTNPYIGIDRSEKQIAYCRETYPNSLFIQTEADDYSKLVDRLNPLFLFSIDYLDLKTVERYIQKTDRVFIAIHYNQPYLSETSVYSGREFIYNLFHPKKKRYQLQALFKRYGGVSFPLCREPFYTVTIIKPNQKNRG